VLIRTINVQHGVYGDGVKIFLKRDSWKRIADNLVENVEHVLMRLGIVHHGNHEDGAKAVATRNSWK